MVLSDLLRWRCSSQLGAATIWNLKICAQDSILHPSSWMTTGKSVHFCEPWLPHFVNGGNAEFWSSSSLTILFYSWRHWEPENIKWVPSFTRLTDDSAEFTPKLPSLSPVLFPNYPFLPQDSPIHRMGLRSNLRRAECKPYGSSGGQLTPALSRPSKSPRIHGKDV